MANNYGKGFAGASTTRRTDFPEFQLGQVERFDANLVGVYGKSAAAQTTGACTVNISTGAIGSGTGYTADGAFAAGEYGWVTKTDVA